MAVEECLPQLCKPSLLVRTRYNATSRFNKQSTHHGAYGRARARARVGEFVCVRVCVRAQRVPWTYASCAHFIERRLGVRDVAQLGDPLAQRPQPHLHTAVCVLARARVRGPARACMRMGGHRAPIPTMRTERVGFRHAHTTLQIAPARRQRRE
jgi:hypothetical protein